MSDVQFIIDFSQQGKLSQTIKDVERLNDLLQKNTELQKQFGSTSQDAVKKAANEFKSLQENAKALAMQMQKSDDAKQIAVLTAEISKLRAKYDELKNGVKGVHDELIKEQKLKQEILKTTRLENLEKERQAKKAAQELKLKQQQNSLYAQQSARLNELRKQYKDLALSENASAKEMRSLLKEITVLDAKLKSVDASVGQFQRNVGNYPSALKGAGISALKFGAALGGVALAGSSVVSFIQQSTKDFSEFDKSLKEVSAITGLAGEELNFFKEAALDAGKTTRTSAKDYLDAVKLIGSASPILLKDKNALKQVTDEAITLSEAAGIDLPTAASALTAGLNQFNLSADNSRRIINALAAGSKEGSAEVSELTDAFKNVGTVANSANISVEDTVALLETLAERQLKGAEAGTKLRGVISKLQQAGVGFKSGKFNIVDALKETSAQLSAIKDPAERAQKEIKLFGLENRVAGSILLQSQERFKELSKAVTGTNTAIEQANINNSSAAAKNEILQNKLQTLRIELGEKLLPIMVKLTEIGVSVVQFFVNLIDAVQADPIKKFREEFELVEKAVEKNKIAVNNLSIAWREGRISADEFRNGVKVINAAYIELEKSTDKTKAEGNELIKQFQSGKISSVEFAKQAAILIEKEKMRRKALKATIEAQKEANQVVEDSIELSDEEAKKADELRKKAEELRKKAYDNAVKRLEKEKILRQIDIEESINDELQKKKAIEQLDIEFIDKRISLEKKYGNDITKLRYDRLLAEKKIKQDEYNLIIEQYKILDQLEFERMKEGEEKDIVSEMRKLENKLEELKKSGKLTKEIEDELTEQTEQSINEIRKRYAQKRYDETINELDSLYTQRETILYETVESEKKLEEFLFQERINRIEDEMRLRKEYLKERKDLTEEEIKKENDIIARLENERAKLRREKREREKEEDKKLNEEILQFTEATASKIEELLQKRINQYEKDVDEQEKNIESQRKLAEQGLENTLAFEKEKAAEKQKQLLEQQRKAEKIKKLEAYFELLAAYAEKEPNTAPVKALAQMKIAEAIVAKLEDGGVLEDVVDNGIFKGKSHKQGGIKVPVIEFEGDEGIFSKREMSRLGKDNFYKLKEQLNSGKYTDDIFNANNEMKQVIKEQQFNVSLNLNPMLNELRELKSVIENKPVPKFYLDRNGNLITVEQAKNYIKKSVQKRKGFNG